MAKPTIPTAAEMMHHKLVTVRPEDDLEKAVRLLLKKGHSGAPVVDADRRLVGVLSEHDCIRVMAQAAAEGWPGGRVEHSMTREVETVGPGEDAFTISSRFTKGGHRRLLVVEDGRLVGLISRRDLMRGLQKFEQARERAGDKSTYDVLEERHRTLD